MSEILDVCCGSRMFWYDKKNSNVIFCDIRNEKHVLCDGREIEIKPDLICDFTDLPFDDNSFSLVVFDPPHLVQAGKNSWLAKKYGVLNKDAWRDELRVGFQECIRVLRPYGTLVFKWNDEQINFSEVLNIIDKKPLFGDRRGKTRWVVFMKEG